MSTITIHSTRSRLPLPARPTLLALVAAFIGCVDSGALGDSKPTSPTPPTEGESTDAAAPTPMPKAPQRVLALLPLGDLDASDVGTAARSISNYYGWIVRVLPAEDPPASAWYAPRKRHRAEKILDWLRPKRPIGADKIMALISGDISTTKPPRADWGICGLADMPGEASVVSTFRIRKKMGNATQAERAERYAQRLSDLVAHEFGHQLGLPHCKVRGCLMEDAKGTVSTFDHSKGELCPACLAKLERAGIAIH